MTRPLATLIFLSIFCLFLPSQADAKTIGLTTVNKVNVRSEPNSRSEALVVLSKGRKMEVLGRKGSFYKVRLRLPDGFSFDGYIYNKSLKIIRRGAPKPRVTPKPAYRPAPPPPRQTYSPPPKKTYKPSKKKYSSSEEVGGSSSWRGFDDRFYIDLGPSVFLYQYKLSNGGATPGQLFSYNLMGLGFRIQSGFWVWQGLQEKLRAGLFANYGHGFLQTSTKLADSTGTEFDTRTSKSSIQDIFGGAAVEYRLKPNREALSFGLKVGYDYFKFNADDIVQNDGTPLNVYVGQTTKTIVLSVYSRIPFEMAKPVYLQLGADLLLLNSVSENPANTTGTDPSASLGFVPYFKVAYGFKENHFAKFGYQARFQNYSYTGTGSRLTTNNLTDASLKTLMHEISISYEFHY